MHNRTMGEVVTIPRVWPSSTKSPLLDLFFPLRNYCGVTSKWSPFDHLDLSPDIVIPHLNCATISEKLSIRPSKFSHPNRIS